MSRQFIQGGKRYLIDDANVLWIARDADGLSDLGFNWEALGSIIGKTTEGISQIIVAKKTGTYAGGGGGTGVAIQADGGRIGGAGSFDLKTVAIWTGLGLLGIMLFKRIAK